MALSKKDNGTAALEKKVAVLEREVASLKSKLAGAGKGGSDPRLDILLNGLKKSGSWWPSSPLAPGIFSPGKRSIYTV